MLAVTPSPMSDSFFHRSSGGPSSFHSSSRPLMPGRDSSWSNYLPPIVTAPAARGDEQLGPSQQRSPSATSSSSRGPYSPADSDEHLRRQHSASISGSFTTGNGYPGSSSSSSTAKPQESSSVGPTPSGRKRKRLQRACVPCHKAKRRCDGGLPCSNCDFSGRGCSYSDSHGNAVQPTARARPPTTKTESHSLVPGNGSVQQVSGLPHCATAIDSGNARLRKADDAEVAADSFRFVASEIPFRAVLSPAMSRHDSMASNPLFALAVGLRADYLCHGSEQGATTLASVRRLLSEHDDTGAMLLDRACPETVLGLLIVALQESSVGKLHRAVNYSTLACRMVQELQVPEGDANQESSFGTLELARLMCIVYIVDIIVSSLNGRAACVTSTDLKIASSNVAHMSNGDPITTAFGVLLQSATIFTTACDHRRKIAHRVYLNREEAEQGAAVCHRLLNAWADALPNGLIFDDGNLDRAARLKANNPGHRHSSDVDACWSWTWSLMHCFTEMAMCILDGTSFEEARKRDDPSRPSAARRNLAVLLLDTMDSETRTSLFALLPFIVAGDDVEEGGGGGILAHASADSQRVNNMTASQRHCVQAYLGLPMTGTATMKGDGSMPGGDLQAKPAVLRHAPAGPVSVGAPRRHPSSPVLAPAFSTMPSLAAIPSAAPRPPQSSRLPDGGGGGVRGDACVTASRPPTTGRHANTLPPLNTKVQGLSPLGVNGPRTLSPSPVFHRPTLQVTRQESYATSTGGGGAGSRLPPISSDTSDDRGGGGVFGSSGSLASSAAARRLPGIAAATGSHLRSRDDVRRPRAVTGESVMISGERSYMPGLRRDGPSSHAMASWSPR